MNDIVDTFAHRLSRAISIRNIKPVDLARKTGISKTNISFYMSGKYEAKQDGVKTLADALNVSPIWLMGFNVPMEKTLDKKSTTIYVYGVIPAGIPIECIEEIIDTEEIDEDMLRGGKKYFGLRVKGDSMAPKYLDGDTIILEKIEDCESGQDCVVMVNGNDGTFKRVIKNENGIILQPLNPEYAPMIYTNEEIEKFPIKIVGKVVELRRKI